MLLLNYPCECLQPTARWVGTTLTVHTIHYTMQVQARLQTVLRAVLSSTGKMDGEVQN